MGGYVEGIYHQYICDRCGIGLPQKRNTIEFYNRIFCCKCWNYIKVNEFKDRDKIKAMYPSCNIS